MESSADLSQSGPRITLVKFDNGNFRLFQARTKEIEEKADFVKNTLPALVGDTPFWMDTLSVDQRNPDDVAAIVRDAARTIAI